jgi:hypothetical protein
VILLQDVVVYMPSIDRKHLAGHAFVAFVPAFAMVQKALANFPNVHLVRVRPVGARLHLAFDPDAKGVGRLLLCEMLALTFAAAVCVVHDPGGLGFAACGLPHTPTD